MNREIKFRAWDKKAGFMFKLDDLDYLLNNNGLYERRVVPFMGDEYRNVSEDYILEQWTGLKDKNGEEIYEGDIIRVKNWTPCGEPPSYSNLEVKWEEVAGSDDMGTDMIGFASYEGCEVVGNIHENPDLLKEGT